MRKYAIHAVIILFLLSCLKTYASPTDGTNIPYNGKYITGYQNNIIFKADAKLSYGNLIQKVNEIDRKNRPPAYYAGAVIGCDVKLTKNTYLSVEGRFIDETSLNTGIYYTF